MMIPFTKRDCLKATPCCCKGEQQRLKRRTPFPTSPSQTPRLFHILALPEGRRIQLFIRPSKRSRRILLRINDRSGEVELVLPKQSTIEKGIAFAQTKASWIQNQLNKLPPVWVCEFEFDSDSDSDFL